jgi:hypothetical protein
VALLTKQCVPKPGSGVTAAKRNRWRIPRLRRSRVPPPTPTRDLRRLGQPPPPPGQGDRLRHFPPPSSSTSRRSPAQLPQVRGLTAKPSPIRVSSCRSLLPDCQPRPLLPAWIAVGASDPPRSTAIAARPSCRTGRDVDGTDPPSSTAIPARPSSRTGRACNATLVQRDLALDRRTFPSVI